MKFRVLVAMFTAFGLASFSHAATKKLSHAATKKRIPAARSAAHTANSSHRPLKSAKFGKRSRSSRRRVAAHRSVGQLAPTPERYKEIQQALADRGYLKAEPTGTWDTPSQDAMRAFQSDQKLEPSGNLTAASLIALGLGPKQDTPAVATGVRPAAPPAAAPAITIPAAQPVPVPADSKPATIPAAVDAKSTGNTAPEPAKN